MISSPNRGPQIIRNQRFTPSHGQYKKDTATSAKDFPFLFATTPRKEVVSPIESPFVADAASIRPDASSVGHDDMRLRFHIEFRGFKLWYCWSFAIDLLFLSFSLIDLDTRPGASMRTFRVIDSHTGGEPTRTIVEGGPRLIGDSIVEQLADMRENRDGFRRAIVNEPRGSEVMVGAYLTQAFDSHNHCGILFFNNVGYLGMCGHGTIGVVATLAYLGKLTTGVHRFETVSGTVSARLHADSTVTIENVPSYRTHKAIELEVGGLGKFRADIAYAGNWFCLVEAPDRDDLDRPVSELLELSSRILTACRRSFPEVDHVELFGPAKTDSANSRNFVLCPGGMYDRSPCGTGTSAKLACLAADESLAEGEVWIQESIIGSTFQASFRWLDRQSGRVVPKITGRAFVNADCQVIVDELDPFAWGM